MTTSNVLIYISCEQGEIVYELIGDYPAQSFFQIDGKTGVISTTSGLKTDSLRAQSYNVGF